MGRRCKNIVFFLLTPFFLGVIILNDVHARIYTFIDEAGTIHFSNVPTDVRYRPASIEKLREQRKLGFNQNDNDSPTVDDILYQYERYIRAAAHRYEVDPLLVKAIIKTESDFNPYAVSRVGAQGLMQLMPDTAKDMEVNDPFDPKQNINGGTKYFRKLLGLFKGDVKLALAAYNAGPTRIRQTGEIPNITETFQYVKKVLSHYDFFKASSPPRKKWVKFSY